MDSLTTTIKREFLDQIVSGRKKIEYREIKPYWSKRLATVRTPFLLRLINGMSATAPEATVEIHRVLRNNAEGCYELHIARIIEMKNMGGSVRPNKTAKTPSDFKVERTRAYFFLWNPNQDTESFENFDTILADAKVGKAYTRYWRCPSKQPRVGDIAYLQRTGKTNNGVFARGTVDEAPIDESDGARRVKLRLNDFLPLGYEIPRNQIVDKARFPAHWGPYASGNKIPARILGAIEDIWDARIAECFGSYPAGS